MWLHQTCERDPDTFHARRNIDPGGPFTPGALMPLCILTMLSVMENIDSNLTKAAATFGGRGGPTFWRVYFPLSVPGIVAGGEVTTLPKQMWDDALLRVSPALAAAATLLLIFMSFVILASKFLRRRSNK